jgi:hypothetical protein
MYTKAKSAALDDFFAHHKPPACASMALARRVPSAISLVAVVVWVFQLVLKLKFDFLESVKLAA